MNILSENCNSIISYQGPFNMRIISSVGKYLSDSINALPHVRMNLYRVFIEQCQNVALYSAERIVQNNESAVGAGALQIISDENFVSCTTVNRISKEHGIVLVNNCTNINNSNNEELNKMKEKLRREAPIKDTGAHIGLISIKIYSSNEINFGIKQNEEFDYFSLTSKISKNKNN